MKSSGAWLVSEGRVLASAEIADDANSRRRGLIGRDHLDGAIIISPCRWIHTFGMKFALDIAYLDTEGFVIKTVHMQRNRLGAPVRHGHAVIEAEAGAFIRWGLHVGDKIEVRRGSDETLTT
ncbi:MAG: DUF192 domain-containing protein [Actinomycetes bacterium]